MSLTRGSRTSLLTVISMFAVCLTVQADAQQSDVKYNGLSFHYGDAHHSGLFDPGLRAPAEEDLSASAPIIALGLFGQTELASSDSEGWVITGGPYLHFPGIEGDAVVAGQAAKLDLSFSDIFDNFDVFGVSGRVEAWKDSRWGITFDVMYFDLDGKFTSPVPLSIDLVQWQIDLGLGLRVIDTELVNEGSGPSRLQFDLLGGGRYQYLKEELKIGASPTLGASEDWFELFVGGRLVLQVNDKLSLRLRGDVGGFGIGDASELTWNVWAGIGYHIDHKMELLIGYKAQGFDYSTGSGLSQFGGDWTTQGISLAMVFRF